MFFGEVYSELDDDEIDIFFSQKVCNHKWKPIVLITSTVYDCEKCEVKKEEYERWREVEFKGRK